MSYRNSLSENLDAMLASGLKGGNIQFEPHQIEGLRRISHFLKGSSGNIANILQACGTGKTWEEIALLEASKRAKESTHTPGIPDILIYTENAIRSGVIKTLEAQGVDFGLWEKGRKPLDREVIVASIQTLQRTAGDTKRILSPETPLIIGDEADLYATIQRMGFLGHFPNALKFGFSATGKWNDGRAIEDAWGETLYTYTLAEAIQDGVVVRPNFLLLESEMPMDSLPKGTRDYSIELLDRVLTEAEIFHGIVNVYSSFIGTTHEHTPTLVYVPSQNLVRRTAAAFKKRFGNNIQLKWWTGDETSHGTMEQDIDEFLNGNVNVLIACDKGGRGMNLPNAKLLIDAYPTSSITKLEQRHPRVMRKNRDNPEGKSHCTIIQIIPKTRKLRPKIFPDIFTDATKVSPQYTYDNGAHRNANNANPHLYNEIPTAELEAIRRNLACQEGRHRLSTLSFIEGAQLPLLGDNESTEIDGEIWGTTSFYMQAFNISRSLILKHLRGKTGKFARKKNSAERISMVPIYPIEYFDKLYAQRSKMKHEIDDFDSGITLKGEEYYTQKLCAKLIGITENEVATLRKNNPLSIIVARCKRNNRFLPLYNYTQLKNIHEGRGIVGVTDSEKTTQFKEGGKDYYTDGYLANKYPFISRRSIANKVSDKKRVRGGKDVGGRVVWVYDEATVAKMNDDTKKLPKAEKEGWISFNGDIYAGYTYLGKKLKDSPTNVKSRCDHHDIPSIQVLNPNNRESKYYLLEAARVLYGK